MCLNPRFNVCFRKTSTAQHATLALKVSARPQRGHARIDAFAPGWRLLTMNITLRSVLSGGALGAGWLFGPATRHAYKFVSDLRPIVQRRRIEVRAIWAT